MSFQTKHKLLPSTKTSIPWENSTKLQKREFLLSNYGLKVGIFMFLKMKYLSDKQSLKGKYAGFNKLNTKFPRGNYQTKIFMSTLIYFLYCSPLNCICMAVQKSYWLIFTFFRWKAWKANLNLKTKTGKNLLWNNFTFFHYVSVAGQFVP